MLVVHSLVMMPVYIDGIRCHGNDFLRIIGKIVIGDGIWPQFVFDCDVKEFMIGEIYFPTVKKNKIPMHIIITTIISTVIVTIEELSFAR